MNGAALRLLLLLLLGLALGACARVGPGTVSLAERDAIAARMMQDITTLASDDFGGRKPGTIGEARTLAYLTGRMQEAGLVSGTNDPGSAWRAPVNLVSTQPQNSRVAFRIGRRDVAAAAGAAVAFTPRRRELAQGGPDTGVNVLFAGTRPDQLTDDEVAGAIIILPDPDGTARTMRESLFARRAGAVLSVVADEAVLTRISGVYENERVRLASDETNTLIAFITEPALADALGSDKWQALLNQAQASDFTSVTLDIGVTIEATSQRREFVSHNLLGMIPGAKPDSGAVLLLAHWDHLGECGPLDAADRICNGAVDNASGVAALLELARRLASGPALDRDIYALATTAEETGLLGARAFAAAPPIALDRFVAAFNFDTVAVVPAGSPVGIVGRGRAAFEPLVLEQLARTRRTLGNPAFGESFLQRQDGWALLQQGLPTVLISSAFASREGLGPYLDQQYHSPVDRAENIELGGAIDDLLLHEAVIRKVADTALYPADPSAP
jgi:aminopeptidase YwaD